MNCAPLSSTFYPRCSSNQMWLALAAGFDRGLSGTYTSSMQIVAGKSRHRKLESNPGETPRPITARVKVALFDRLQLELQEARIADIFAGTGTIGLEALSRGAASVVFVESDREAAARLRRNVAALKAEAETMCW